MERVDGGHPAAGQTSSVFDGDDDDAGGNDGGGGGGGGGSREACATADPRSLCQLNLSTFTSLIDLIV